MRRNMLIGLSAALALVVLNASPAGVRVALAEPDILGSEGSPAGRVPGN